MGINFRLASMKRPRRFAQRTFFLAGFAPWIFAALLYPDTGTIKGKVTDPERKPLKDVNITLKDEAQGRAYSTKTDKNGNYYLKGIVPADYRLTFEKDGYRSLEGPVSITSGTESDFDTILIPAPAAAKPAQPSWQEKNLKAHDLYVEQRFGEALALYREILASNPNVAFIHFDAGNCSFHLQDYEAAIKSFLEAVRLNPGFIEAYTNLANTYARLKRFDEGIPVLENAIRTNPANGRLFISLGLLYFESGQEAKAVKYLEKAVAIEPKNPAAHYSLALACARAGAYAKAIESYEKYAGLISDEKEIGRVKEIIEELKPLVKK